MNSRPEHFVFPDLCNTTSLALLILFSQLLVVVLLFAGGDVSWVQMGLMSLFVQWITLVSAGLLCSLRRWIVKLDLVYGASIAMLIVVLVTLLVGFAAEFVIDRGPGMLERLAGQVAIAGIITGLVLRYFYVQQRLRLQEQAELQSRIQALQSRIRPHFLFNSMNIIASLIAVDPDTAETVVEDLSALFRASLNETGNQVPLQEELSLCERYLRIESLRLGERLVLDWDIEPAQEQVMVPLLTLQPLLENAIYHGIQPLPEGGTILVRLRYAEEDVAIRIENPIPDDSQSRESEGNQMALNNIRSRLAVLYGDTAQLTTGAVDGIFVTELSFPKTITQS
ncbi:MAG: sensor histidine kinase [Pseudomonadales bacterium]